MRVPVNHKEMILTLCCKPIPNFNVVRINMVLNQVCELSNSPLSIELEYPTEINPIDVNEHFDDFYDHSTGARHVTVPSE